MMHSKMASWPFLPVINFERVLITGRTEENLRYKWRANIHDELTFDVQPDVSADCGRVGVAGDADVDAHLGARHLAQNQRVAVNFLHCQRGREGRQFSLVPFFAPRGRFLSGRDLSFSPSLALSSIPAEGGIERHLRPMFVCSTHFGLRDVIVAAGGVADNDILELM